ncbi:MAG: thymidine phosphorylase [Acidobacteria bacterium RIFCSPLOWO2_02_FULL_68_18]|nr:MAG: thymidine phosphorylase [Acidobacteria bacterium RIFCSPLOWO2_02_FULL_68_18]OFW51525.1 MAG: thymidine phosphorylase [Acidobacteria bacterium RIFCSPLOWO2_12_FULL_68_19]
MGFVDVIANKRDGRALSRADIEGFVTGVTAAEIPDYQAAALLMAIAIRGMSDEETAWLTEAMVRSGDRVDLSGIPGVKVGKHSTGGVGDKVSLVLAPLAAACGVVVPKMSGRGLGHTGGTLDKLESIPGYRTDLTIDEFKDVLRRVGTSIIGPTAALAPADKRLYALRDVTATVSSVPLIAASVMSKKLAEGGDALVLDVKCGRGAFMKSPSDARELARRLVAIGAHAGLRTEAFITAMDAPLGRAVGNALEIVECLETLKGRGPADLVTLAVTLAARMLVLAGRAGEAEAEGVVRRALASGAALDTMRALIEAHRGDSRVVDDYARLPHARCRSTVPSPAAGYVAAIHADLVGRASMALGAGRQRIDAPIDRGAGVLVLKKPGEPVAAGETVLELLYNDDRGLSQASALAREAIEVAEAPPAPPALVLGRVA